MKLWKKNKPATLFYFKTGILLFWSLWFYLAFMTNFFDFINSMGVLPDTWHFRSGNFLIVRGILSSYTASGFFSNMFFILDMLIQLCSALLFFCAAFSFYRRGKICELTNVVFAISMGLWAFFILMDEIFIAYSFEHNHMIILAFELLTFMSLYVLPDKFKE